MAERGAKAPERFRDCVVGDELEMLHEQNETHKDLENPIKHEQIDGKTNNVTFVTTRGEKWKEAILQYFGPSKASAIKSGSVIKVVCDMDTDKECTIKINFYKSGSVVIQGQKCTDFSDVYFDTLKEKVNSLDLNNNAIGDIDLEETDPKTLLTSNDNTLPKKPSSPIKSVTEIPEIKMTPKDRVSQYGKTMEHKFQEIHTVLKTIDTTMLEFVNKLGDLSASKDKIPPLVNTLITETFDSLKQKILDMLSPIENKVKTLDNKISHTNTCLDAIHVKANLIDSQLKQISETQKNQDENMEKISSLVSKLEDRIDEIECRSIEPDLSKLAIHRLVPNTHTQGENEHSSQYSNGHKENNMATDCDFLILGDSVLRRIQPRRFTPQGKTVVRFIRGGAKTCTNFIQNNAQKFKPKNVLINIGTRDLQNAGVNHEDFSDLFHAATDSWKNSKIYVLPIINRKDRSEEEISSANNTIRQVCESYPVNLLEKFAASDDMFHDEVHLNFQKGLPALVKHLKETLGIYNYKNSNRGNFQKRQTFNGPKQQQHVNNGQFNNGPIPQFPPMMNPQNMGPWIFPPNHQNFLIPWRLPWNGPPPNMLGNMSPCPGN